MTVATPPGIADVAERVFTRDALFVAGTWTRREDRGRLDIIDPATEELIGSVPEADEQDADAAIAAAVEASASSPWLGMNYAERARVISRIADELDERTEEIAESYVHDAGGLRTLGAHLVAQADAVLRAHELLARQIAAEEWRENGGERTLLVRKPVGPVLAVVPRHGTLVLAVVKLAPALLAGCPIVVKVAPEDPTTSFLLAEAVEAAGVPAGMVSFLPGRSSRLGDLPGRPEFAHVTFTGSMSTGMRIMASAARNTTAVTLELGGEPAGIFLEDVEPAEGVRLVAPDPLGRSGRACATYSRLLVPTSREDEWIEALSTLFESLPIGDPADPATVVGPLVSAEDRERVERSIALARDEGATILAGGQRPAGHPFGYFVEPTLVGDVTPDMRIVREEVVGPIVTVQGYRTLDEAVELAGYTPFGLAAGIFTSEPAAAIGLVRRLATANVAIDAVGAYVVQPCGGYGYGTGREVGVGNVLALTEVEQIGMPGASPP